MRKILALMITSLVTFTMANASSDSNSIPNFNAHYKIYKGGIKAAKAHLSLKKNGNQYVYKSVTDLAGIFSLLKKQVRTEISNWEYDANKQIKVRDYSFTHMKGKKRKKYRTIKFDWTKNQALNKFKQQKITVKLKPGAIDKFTLQLAVMRDLKQNKKTLDYTIVDDGKLKHYHFTILGYENIKTPAGTYKAIKIKRERKKKKRTTYMWCAPKLHFLPVKILHVEKSGSKASMELSSITGL